MKLDLDKDKELKEKENTDSGFFASVLELFGEIIEIIICGITSIFD